MRVWSHDAARLPNSYITFKLSDLILDSSSLITDTFSQESQHAQRAWKSDLSSHLHCHGSLVSGVVLFQAEVVLLSLILTVGGWILDGVRGLIHVVPTSFHLVLFLNITRFEALYQALINNRDSEECVEMNGNPIIYGLLPLSTVK